MNSRDALGEYIHLSVDLDKTGLVWYPEIGDEVSERSSLSKIAILVDPQGLTPTELRKNFIWLPTVEQLVEQFEARQALIYHAGISDRLSYEAVVRYANGVIETCATTLRLALGKALQELLANSASNSVH